MKAQVDVRAITFVITLGPLTGLDFESLETKLGKVHGFKVLDGNSTGGPFINGCYGLTIEIDDGQKLEDVVKSKTRQISEIVAAEERNARRRELAEKRRDAKA